LPFAPVAPAPVQNAASAFAAATWSVELETETGASAGFTPARAAGRSSAAMAPSPTRSHNDVAPRWRSASTSAFVNATSGSSCSARTSHAVPWTEAPRVKGIAPGTPSGPTGSVYRGSMVRPSTVLVRSRDMA